MSEPTSDDLRARYRELMHTADTRAGQITDTEENELMEICRLLSERGYVVNIDLSDWFLDLSPNRWLLQDET